MAFRRIAIGLSQLGVKAGDRIAIISENRLEWSLTDLAILSLKAVNIPIYTTQAVEQIRRSVDKRSVEVENDDGALHGPVRGCGRSRR